MESIYNLRYTKAATKDIEKIMDYLADYGNPNIINFQKVIDRKTASIMFQPYINMVVFHFQGYDFRRIVIKGYIFIYYVDEDSKDVYILESSTSLRIMKINLVNNDLVGTILEWIVLFYE